jgi:hypothetical protein
MAKLIFNIFTFFILVAMSLQASSNIAIGKVETYAKKDFLAEFGDSYVKGDIAKVEHFKSRNGSFFMVLSIETKPFDQPYRKPSDADVSHNIYAYGFVEDHGGLKKIWGFKDFSNIVYIPRFYIKESGIVDTNNDGTPEMIVAYFGESDGLDAKELKIITYVNRTKYKATAFYPAGNEDDRYHITHDANWKLLPKTSQAYVNKLFKTFKLSNYYEYIFNQENATEK